MKNEPRQIVGGDGGGGPWVLGTPNGGLFRPGTQRGHAGGEGLPGRYQVMGLLINNIRKNKVKNLILIL